MKLSIGEVSKIFNISRDTLRYYDKIGILKPEVNTENGYRHYLLKHLEKLGLIVGIKYLGISLADIKSTIESEEILEYRELIIRQEDIVHKKIKELQELEANLDKSKKILDSIINFSNEYDFSNLEVREESYYLYGVGMKNILKADVYYDEQLTLENELSNLKDESYYYRYKIIENKFIEEDEDVVFVKENENILNLLKKALDDHEVEFISKRIHGNVVSTHFYGTVKEINDYLILMNRYFNCPENNNVFVKYDFYLPKKDEEVMYFVNINLEI